MLHWSTYIIRENWKGDLPSLSSNVYSCTDDVFILLSPFNIFFPIEDENAKVEIGESISLPISVIYTGKVEFHLS